MKDTKYNSAAHAFLQGIDPYCYHEIFLLYPHYGQVRRLDSDGTLGV